MISSDVLLFENCKPITSTGSCSEFEIGFELMISLGS